MIAADIVIVNWNSGDLLRQCLRSLKAYSDGVAKVIVVDNGSTDGSLAIAEREDNVDIVEAGCNLGFAKACNLGAGRCTAPYILFLNPDAELRQGGLPRVLAFMESAAAADVGICGVRLFGSDGTVQRHCSRFPTPHAYFGHATGLSRILPAWFPPHFMVDFDHLSSRTVDQTIGAYFVVRAALFEQLGGFDERFFVYAEEMDFALRAKLAGWRTYYLSEATGFHHGGGTTDQVKAHRLFYSVRSKILYSFKNFSRPKAWVCLLTFIAIEPIFRLGRAVLRLSRREAADVAKGYSMLYRDLAAIVRTSRGAH